MNRGLIFLSKVYQLACQLIVEHTHPYFMQEIAFNTLKCLQSFTITYELTQFEDPFKKVKILLN